MKRSSMPAAPPKPPEFSAIPFGISLDLRIGPAAVRIVAALLQWSRESAVCTMTLADLGTSCNLSRTAVLRGLDQLEQAGYIRHEPGVRTSANWRGRRTRLLWVEDPSIIPEVTPLPAHRLSRA